MSTISDGRIVRHKVRPLRSLVDANIAIATPMFIDVLRHQAEMELRYPSPYKSRPDRLPLLAEFFGERRVADYDEDDSRRFVQWFCARCDAVKPPRIDPGRRNPRAAAVSLLRLLRRAVRDYGHRHRIRLPEIHVPFRSTR